MTPERYFIAQAYNNAWANHRLLKACALLSAEDLAAPRQNFFPSIIHTLNHILTVDWLYIGALEGHCPGASAFEPEIPFPAFADLDREQRAADRRLIHHCRSLTDETLCAEVSIPRDMHMQVEPTDRILLHLFIGQTLEIGLNLFLLRRQVLLDNLSFRAVRIGDNGRFRTVNAVFDVVIFRFWRVRSRFHARGE